MGVRDGQGYIFFPDDSASLTDSSSSIPVVSGTGSGDSGSGIAVKRQPSLSGTAKDPLLCNRKLSFLSATPPPNIHIEMLVD